MDLDPTIALACDACPAPTSPLAPLCAMMGITVAAYWQVVTPRVFTGYQTADARKDVRGRSCRDGLSVPTRRETATDRAMANAAKSGFVAGRWVG